MIINSIKINVVCIFHIYIQSDLFVALPLLPLHEEAWTEKHNDDWPNWIHFVHCSAVLPNIRNFGINWGYSWALCSAIGIQ